MAKVLVTGGAGFIGSHVVERLLADKHQVRVLDNLLSGKRAFVPLQADFVEGDVTNPEHVTNAMDGIERVVHLAALRSVPASWENPDEYQRVNVQGTQLVCAVACDARVKRLVNISSSSVYGIAPQPLREGREAERVESPYARTKREAEGVAMRAASKGLDVVSLRYFNVIGPRQDPAGGYATFVIGAIRKLLGNEQVIINEDGEQTRDFNPVANAVHGTLLALFSEREFRGEQVNIASGAPRTVNQAFETVRRSVARYRPEVLGVQPVRTGQVRKGDIRDNVADLTKARFLLGYVPVETFAVSVDKTVDYFVAQRSI